MKVSARTHLQLLMETKVKRGISLRLARACGTERFDRPTTSRPALKTGGARTSTSGRDAGG